MKLQVQPLNLFILFHYLLIDVRRLQQRLVLLWWKNFESLHSFRESYITIFQHHPTTTHIPIESLKTCATILCLGATINTTSSYLNMAVWHSSVHSVRYDLLFAILCHRQSIFKRSINVVDLEWLCLHLFCPANWPLIVFLQFHNASCRDWSPHRRR